MVWHKAATTKAARTAELVNPLGPLGVQMTIGLFILRFKHTYDVLRERKGEGGGCVYRETCIEKEEVKGREK